MPIPESEIERMEMERMIDWNFGKERQYIKPKAPTPGGELPGRVIGILVNCFTAFCETKQSY